MLQQKGKENKRHAFRLYSVNEYGFTDLPTKVGPFLGKWIASVQYPCRLCFMVGRKHGKRRYHQVERNWKEYRLHQWERM
jgi:hypothetical protein